MYRTKVVIAFATLFWSALKLAGQGIILYTPYTQISVSPGESVEYSVEVINKTKTLKNVPLYVKNLPQGWTYDLKSGGWKLTQISVLGDEKKTVNLKIDIPYVVKKGTYHFQLISPGIAVLPLTIEITKEGTSRSELSTTTPSMPGQAGSTFSFNLDLRNRSADRQVYVLSSEAPKGWDVIFKSAGKYVSSVNIESGNTEKLVLEVTPPSEVPAGDYNIRVFAATATNTASLDLTVTIKGSFKMELTTPRELLSTSVPVGRIKELELWVKNTGSSTLSDITLEYSAPTGWEVAFEPKKIIKIEPGQYETVTAKIKSDRKSIPGDYVVNLEARNQETNSKISLRVSVRTPLLYGWLGLAVIALGIFIIYYLFKKYGRR